MNFFENTKNEPCKVTPTVGVFTSFFLVFCFFFFGFFTKTFHFSQYNIFKWFFKFKIISFFFKTGNEYSGTSTGFWWSPDETVFISGPKISKLYLSNESF